jgi:hypothetical protein
MVAKIAVTPARKKVATLNIAPLIAMWASGLVGPSAPSTAVVAPDTALVTSSLLLVMVVRLALTPAKMRLATLTIAPWIAIWASGLVGASAPSPAVVVPDIALVTSIPLPVMVAKLAVTPAKMRLATLVIVQWIAMWASGLVGVSALSPAVVVPDIAPVTFTPLQAMVAMTAPRPASMKIATLPIVQLIAI